jgi:hypothetical protein
MNIFSFSIAGFSTTTRLPLLQILFRRNPESVTSSRIMTASTRNISNPEHITIQKVVQSIAMTIQVATPAFGPIPPKGNLVKTCNLLVLNHKLHEEYNFVYQRFPAEDLQDMPDPMDYLDKWFD